MSRLVYLTSARLPTEKAHGIQIMKMCEAFATNGLDVTLLYPRRRPPPELAGRDDPFAFYGVEHQFTAARLACLDIDAVKRISEPLWFWTVDLSATVSVLREARRLSGSGTTLFYTRDPLMMRAGMTFARAASSRWAFEAHRSPSSPRAARRLGGGDALFVVTEALARTFTESGVPEERVHIAPDGVDVRAFTVESDPKSCRAELGLPLERPIVGYVGRFQTMGEEKGITELIEAMGDERVRDAVLVCVGGPMGAVERYRAVARQRAIAQERLLFFDRVPHQQVPLWIRAFDVAAMPFPDTPHYAHAMSPMKLFEYMAAAAPILATDLPSVREVLSHDENAWLVAPGSAKALADGLSHLLDHRADAEKLGERARADASAYTWERRAKSILAALGS